MTDRVFDPITRPELIERVRNDMRIPCLKYSRAIGTYVSARNGAYATISRRDEVAEVLTQALAGRDFCEAA